jgi:hypothetical protein
LKRSSLPRLAVLAVCLVAVAAAMVPATAGAAGGYHMSRPFIDTDGSSTRAVGKLCTGSKYGNWRWHVTIGSGDLRVSYRWIEPIYPDGKARNLNFTYIGGPLVDEQPTKRLRDLFRSTVKHNLDKITVKLTGGRLVYENPFSDHTSSKAFRPVRGC